MNFDYVNLAGLEHFYSKLKTFLSTKYTTKEELEQAIANFGGFQVVSLNQQGKPDVANPSTKIIYLTKEAGSSKTDPYTEWICTNTTGPVWEIIGETTPEINEMIGATASTAGSAGLVPAPAAGDQDKVLGGDGTWKNYVKPSDVFSGSTSGLVPSATAGDANKVLKGDGTWGDAASPIIAAQDNPMSITPGQGNQLILGVNSPFNSAIADAFSNARTYAVGDYVTYKSEFYRCTTVINPAEEWNASHWTKVKISDIFTGSAPGLVPAPSAGSIFRFLAADGTWKEIDLSNEVSNSDLGHLVVELFSNQKPYSVGEYCIYNKVLYKCTTAVQTAGDWTGSVNWTEISILEVIDEKILAIDLSPYLTETDLGNVVATIWNKATANTVGQYVIHERKLYRCTANTTAGADWTGSSNWSEVKLTNLVSNSAPGLMPTLSGNINDVMRGNGTYGAVASISYDSVNQEVTISFNTPSA